MYNIIEYTIYIYIHVYIYIYMHTYGNSYIQLFFGACYPVGDLYPLEMVQMNI